ncbi:hypothetical protein BGP_0388 [Beggiatoa sp. PS]|nr:hypothetical protein BGP_0388 [Beggiatoa sp. PS]
MASIEEINFRLIVTRIYRKDIDKLIECADTNREALINSLDEENKFDLNEFHSLIHDVPKIAFSLYALAIIHCYSILENNRKLICLRIPELTDGQKNNLHNIRVVTQCLKKLGLKHEKVRCYKTMNEFRLVNNAIKHDRYNLSTSITTEERKKYKTTQLKSLYLNRSKHLETYLSDLYRRVKT